MARFTFDTAGGNIADATVAIGNAALPSSSLLFLYNDTNARIQVTVGAGSGVNINNAGTGVSYTRILGPNEFHTTGIVKAATTTAAAGSITIANASIMPTHTRASMVGESLDVGIFTNSTSAI